MALKMSEEGRNMLKRECVKCAHFPLCIINRTIAPFITQAFPEVEGKKTAPFEPNQLSEICIYYTSPIGGIEP